MGLSEGITSAELTYCSSQMNFQASEHCCVDPMGDKKVDLD